MVRHDVAIINRYDCMTGLIAGCFFSLGYISHGLFTCVGVYYCHRLMQEYQSSTLIQSAWCGIGQTLCLLGLRFLGWHYVAAIASVYTLKFYLLFFVGRYAYQNVRYPSFLIACVWMLLDTLHAYEPNLLCNSLGGTQIQTPWFLVFSIWGETGVSFFIALCSRLKCIGYVCLFLYITHTSIQIHDSTQQKSKKSIHIAMIQGSLNRDDYTYKNSEYQFNRYAQMTQKVKSADLLIWPEQAINDIAHQNATLEKKLRNIQHKARYFILGMVVEKNGSHYNSIRILNAKQQEQFIYKHDLVFDAESGFNTYPLAPSIAMIDHIPVGFFICLESTHSDLFYHAIQSGAQAFVVLMQGALLHDTFVMRIHLNKTRIRAIEYARNLALSSQYEGTTLINEQGITLQGKLHSNEYGFFQGKLTYHNHMTPYAQFGTWLWPLCTCTTLLILLLIPKKQLYNKKHENQHHHNTPCSM